MARKYSKLNFVDAVKIITPDVYLDDDRNVSGLQIKLTDEVINSHLVSLNSISDTLNVSALGGFPSYSSLNNPSGFSQFFVKQNNLTKITTRDFDKKVLKPLGIKMTDYSTSSEFLDFLSGTLLPKISLNSNNLLVDTSAKYASTPSATHAYLIDNLSWLYFLNTDAPVLDPSTIVASSMMEKFYFGKSYLINDGLKDYQQYLWENYSNFSSLNSEFLPNKFLSGTGTYTSGNQNLEKLKTLIDVIYSPLHIDSEDETVKDAIETFIGSDTTLKTTEPAGPLHKFLQAVSYLLRDIDNQVESIETLPSIMDCPTEFLPYLANLLGWSLYGNNEISWRNQIKNAVRLYKKKGTKESLVEAMNTIIVQNPIDTSSAVTELYESYIPNLIYYLLLTESPILNSDDFSLDDALAFGIDSGGYSASNKDQTIRAAVDNILKRAVERYPSQFFIRNEPFRVHILNNGQGYFGPVNNIGTSWFTGTIFTDSSEPIAVLGDPAFTFNYRTRDFGIPPWEEEKFYRNCLITRDILRFFQDELSRFCVDKNYVDSFYDYIYNYTLSGTGRTDLYLGNNYVLFTSGLELPPNHSKIIDDFDYKDYDYLSLWNGKSSTFDFTVLAGDFSSLLFQDSSGLYTTGEVLDSLKIVEDFSPAKADPRTRIILAQTEFTSGVDFICPSIRYNMPDVVASAAGLGNYEISGIWSRGVRSSLGGDIYPLFDDSRSHHDHLGLPVFTREGSKYSNNVANSVVNTSATVPESSGIPRVSLRRRNFHNVLNYKGWYGRDGFNMPTLYNNTSGVLNTYRDPDYVPLGFEPSGFGFGDGGAGNLSGVYSNDCAGSASVRSYFGLDVSNAFYSRDYESLAFSACDHFVRRDILPEEVYTFFKINEYKKAAIAKEIINHNFELLSPSSAWVNMEQSFANQLPDQGFDKFLSPIIDKRKFSTGVSKGIQEIYNTYNKFFLSSITGSALPENLLLRMGKGGPNILSHTYGPIYYNADFSIDGSAIRDDLYLQNGRLASDIISRTLINPVLISLNSYSTSSLTNVGGSSVGGLLVSSVDSSTAPYYGGPEYTTQNFLSGVSFVDTSSNTDSGVSSNNLFAIYNLKDSEKAWAAEYDNYLINNPFVYLQHSGHGLPRIQFNLSGFSPSERNILIPEHDFEASVNFLVGKLDSVTVGGGTLGVLLRTKVEKLIDGTHVVFFWTPGGKWEMVNVADISTSVNSRDLLLKSYTHFFSGGPEIDLIQDPYCDISLDNNSLLRYVNKENIQTAKIKFHTKNKLSNTSFEYGTQYDSNNSDVYNGKAVQLHRAFMGNTDKNQDYILEVFQYPTSNQEKGFVIVDNISVIDKTLNDAAEVPYKATIPSLRNQMDVVASPQLLLPSGKPLTLKVTDATDIVDFDSPDLFRTMSGRTTTWGSFHPMRYNSELWTVVGAPDLDSYYDPPGFMNGYDVHASPGAKIMWRFAHGYPTTGLLICQSNPPPGCAPLYGLTLMDSGEGAPWGKVPFTGICNSTLTAHQHGLDVAVFDPPSQDNNYSIFSDEAKKKSYLAQYWNDRKGFLSFNEWSPYVNSGPREVIGDEANASIGQGAGLPFWPEMSEKFDEKQGAPLLALSRPGHSYREQWVEGEDFLDNGPVSFGETNPLGFRRVDDEFSYSNMYANFGSNNMNGPTKTSVGSPIMTDFTTRRVKCNYTESNNLQVELGELGNEANWEYVPNGGDPLLPTILDPKGLVASSLAIYQVVNVKINNEDITNQYNTFDWESVGGISKFTDDGHGITFPPMSVYRDVSRDKLIHAQRYSFSVYVRGNASVAGETRDLYATSAMLTISTIGTTTSYTRLNITVPDFDSGESVSLTREMNGHTLTGLNAGEVETISVPVANDPNTTVNWYKMRVTMPYDALEKDISGKENLGIRCTLQAYNDRFDNLLPEHITGNAATKYTHEHIPCKLLTWGYGLWAAPDSGTFRRITGDITKVGRHSFGIHSHPEGLNPNLDFSVNPGVIPNVIMYDSNAAGVDSQTEYYYTNRKIVHGEDKQLYVYDKDVSGLKKLTLVDDVADNDLFNSKLYKTVKIEDTSGVRYTGPIEYSLSRNLIRPPTFTGEIELERILSASGDGGGTNVGVDVEGSVPVTPEDLLHLLRYFNRLGKDTCLVKVGAGLPPSSIGGFNTRVPYYSSGIHNVSGGSRLSYRSNPDNGAEPTNSVIVSGYTNYAFLDTSAT